MDRGYTSPGVEIFRNEEITIPNTTGQVIYGIVGPTTKGPYGNTEISAIKKLHDIFGYGFLGLDSKGNRVISDAIIAAERVLSYSNKIVFTRVALNAEEDAKFTRTTEDMLQYTISNKDTTVKNITVHHDGYNCTVNLTKVEPTGEETTIQLCSVTTEEDLKKALEYEGTLTDVYVPEGYFNRIAPPETKYTFESYPSESAVESELYATGEVQVVESDGTFTKVKVLSNVAPDGTVIPEYVGKEFVVNATKFIVDSVYELFNEDGTSTSVWVKIKSETPGESNDDVYVPNFNAFNINLTNEITSYSNKDAVNVQVLAAPMGSVIELGKETLEDKIEAYRVVNSEILKVVNSTGGRGDCVGLFDYPKNLKYEDGYRLFNSPWYRGIDEQQVLVAFPAVKASSIYTGDLVELGSSTMWLDRMAYTDSTQYPWIAPAGYGSNKGVISGAVSVNDVLDKERRDVLYAIKINPVVKFVGKGIVLFGNRTFEEGTPYQDPSLFEKVNVVRLCNYITRIGYDVSLDILFEPNDKTTWNQWTARMTTEMEKIKANRGIEKYKIIMDETTVSEEDKLLGKAPALIKVLPIGALEYIPIHLTLTDSAEVFGEEV